MFEIGGIYDFTMIEGYDDQGKPHNDLLWRYRVVSIDGPLLDIDPEMAAIASGARSSTRTALFHQGRASAGQAADPEPSRPSGLIR